jgi:hypothetical protein
MAYNFPKKNAPERIPCLPERGFAHHRSMEVVGPGREVGRCSFCDDERTYSTDMFPVFETTALAREAAGQSRSAVSLRPLAEEWAH